MLTPLAADEARTPDRLCHDDGGDRHSHAGRHRPPFVDDQWSAVLCLRRKPVGRPRAPLHEGLDRPGPGGRPASLLRRGAVRRTGDLVRMAETPARLAHSVRCALDVRHLPDGHPQTTVDGSRAHRLSRHAGPSCDGRRRSGTRPPSLLPIGSDVGRVCTPLSLRHP